MANQEETQGLGEWPLEEVKAYGIVQRACRTEVGKGGWTLDKYGMEIGDLVQEVYLRYMENVDKFQIRNESGLFAWAWTTARNYLGDRSRRKEPDQPLMTHGQNEEQTEELRDVPDAAGESPLDRIIEVEERAGYVRSLKGILSGMTLDTVVLFLLIFLPIYWTDLPEFRELALDQIAQMQFKEGAELSGLGRGDCEALLNGYAAEYEGKDKLPINLVAQLTGRSRGAIDTAISRERGSLRRPSMCSTPGLDEPDGAAKPKHPRRRGKASQ